MVCPVHQQGGSAQRRFPLPPSCRCTRKRKGRDYLSRHGERRARGPANLWIVQSQSRKCAAVGKGQPLTGSVRLGGGGVGALFENRQPSPLSEQQRSEMTWKPGAGVIWEYS